jgi:hypothetical protein
MTTIPTTPSPGQPEGQDGEDRDPSNEPDATPAESDTPDSEGSVG